MVLSRSLRLKPFLNHITPKLSKKRKSKFDFLFYIYSTILYSIKFSRFRCGDCSIGLAEVNGRKILLKPSTPSIIRAGQGYSLLGSFLLFRVFLARSIFLFPVDFRFHYLHKAFPLPSYAPFRHAGKRQKKFFIGGFQNEFRKRQQLG